MPHVRPHLLERFYAAMLAGTSDPSLSAELTFDEYYAIQRLHYPKVTRWTAAQNAPHEHLRPAEPAPEPEPPGRRVEPFHTSRLASLDLGEAEIPETVQSLVLDRIRAIGGFDRLSRFDRLEILTIALSGSADRAAASPPIVLDRVEVRACSAACVDIVLRSTAARAVSFDSPAPISLALLDHYEGLRELSAGSPWVRDVDRLADRPLESLSLASVRMDAALRVTLTTLTPTLRALSISSDDPIGPAMLPELSTFAALRRLEIFTPDFEEHRDAWLSCAVLHPEVDIVFGRRLPSPTRMEVAEIRRGVDIVRSAKGEKVVFEVSGDLASDGGAEDNGDLEGRLRAEAKTAKKKGIRWSSEADTFVARTKDLDTARWIVDRILGAG